MTVKDKVMKNLKTLLLLLLLPMLALTALDALAQEAAPTETPEGEPSAPEAPITHIIVEGENLTTIAAQYEVTVADLMLVNGLDENSVIHPGQELIIPGGEGALVAASYTVQVGDSLLGVARHFSTTVAAIAGTNRLVGDPSMPARPFP